MSSSKGDGKIPEQVGVDRLVLENVGETEESSEKMEEFETTPRRQKGMVALPLENKLVREGGGSARWKSKSCQRKVKGHQKVETLQLEVILMTKNENGR